MKKSLIALAVLAASGAAMAQSSVTLYGRADVNYTWDNYGTPGFKQNSGGLGGSRIGFRGVEDLGNGLKAGFVVETGYNVDSTSTATSLGNRQSFLSLSGGFGELRFGRQYTLNDSFAGTYGGAHGTVWSNAGTVISSNGTRNSNAATYISPNFSGFKVTAQAATKEEYTDAVGGGSRAPYALGLDYANGPVGIGFTASKNGLAGDDAIYQIGGSYNFGPVALIAAYEYDKNKDDEAAYTAGVKVPLGATTIRATYGVVDQASAASGRSGSQSLFLGQKVKVAGLGADYKLSKRSTVYAGYAYVKGETGSAATDGKKTLNQVIVGFDHWF